MTFVDTSVWFALFVPSDSDYAAANHWLTTNRSELVTSDYVFDELLTLLKARNEYSLASRIGELLLNRSMARFEWVTTADFQLAWRFFRDFRDKSWSFTDCVSFAMMQRLAIRKAFAFDHHFRQFGTINVVP